ncbi:MAG: ABC transporter substrate-binding protein [Spirochaetes bacterium]|jgi:ABC-type phosphate/phosphonate transport system substrate-binding protein|nr:ABC transporter substrate-binding protein [Spirochaetota bacterium]
MKTAIVPSLLIVLLTFTCCSPPLSSDQTDGTITKSLIVDSLAPKKELRTGVNSFDQNIHLIFANGGATTATDSFFDKKGISVRLTEEENTQTLFNQLLADDIDIAIMPLNEYMYERAQKNNDSTTIFLITGHSTGHHSVHIHPQYNPPEKLKGKKIALVANSSEQALLDLYLKSNLIAPDSIERIFTNSSKEASELFNANEVEAAALSTAGTPAETAVITTRDASLLVPYIAVASNKLLLSQTELLTMFAEGMLEANSALFSHSRPSSLITTDMLPSHVNQARLLQTITPASFKDNLNFFSISNNGDPDINTLLNISQLLPPRFYEQTTKTLFSLYTPLIAELIDLPSHIKNRTTSQYYPARSPQLPLIPIPLPFEDDGWEITSFHERKFTKIKEIASLFPSSVIRLSYIPNHSASSRYTAEQRISVCSRRLYQVLRDRSNLRIETNYSSISSVNSSNYQGPYAEKSSVIIEIMAVQND